MWINARSYRPGFGGATVIRDGSGCPVRQRVRAARGGGGDGRREPLCARAQSYTRPAIRLRWCRITSRKRTDPLRVQALIANMTQPALSAVAGIVQVEGAEVLVVEVPDSPRVVGTTRGTYVRRAIAGDGRPTCVPYHAHEMLAHEVDRGAV